MSNSDNQSPAASTRSTSKTNSPTATGAHPFEIRTYTTPNPNVLHPSKFLDPNILDKLKKTMCPVCNNGCEEMSVCCEQCQQWFHATCNWFLVFLHSTLSLFSNNLACAELANS